MEEYKWCISEILNFVSIIYSKNEIKTWALY